jgi:hypothetical protein
MPTGSAAPITDTSVRVDPLVRTLARLGLGASPTSDRMTLAETRANAVEATRLRRLALEGEDAA